VVEAELGLEIERQTEGEVISEGGRMSENVLGGGVGGILDLSIEMFRVVSR